MLIFWWSQRVCYCYQGWCFVIERAICLVQVRVKLMCFVGVVTVTLFSLWCQFVVHSESWFINSSFCTIEKVSILDSSIQLIISKYARVARLWHAVWWGALALAQQIDTTVASRRQFLFDGAGDVCPPESNLLNAQQAMSWWNTQFRFHSIFYSCLEQYCKNNAWFNLIVIVISSNFEI